MNILEEANEIIFKRSQEKQRTYGPIEDSMRIGAEFTSQLTGKDITTEDYYKLLIALKFSRMCVNPYKRDTLVDLVAYIAALNDFYINHNLEEK